MGEVAQFIGADGLPHNVHGNDPMPGIDAAVLAVVQALRDIAKASRSAGVLHRSAVAAADKVTDPGDVLTLSGQTISGGALAAGTTYYASVAAVVLQAGSGAILGWTKPCTIKNAAPGGANNALRVAWAAITGADGYLIFLSADAAPKLVAFVTEAERAAGGIISADGGAVGAGGTAGAIDLKVAGSGRQTSVAEFGINTAHRLGAITEVDCAGRNTAYIHIRSRKPKSANPAGALWSAAPTLTLLPWYQSGEENADWFAGSAIAAAWAVASTDPMAKVTSLDVSGAAGLKLSVDAIAGITAGVDVWVELV